MGNKVTIIGAGSVGSTIAYTLAVQGQVSEIVMIDVNTKKALGEAMDIRQGTPFMGACKIYAGSYEDAAGSDIVIITSGIARKPGQTRLELCQINVNILKSITPQIVKHAPNAIYVFVSNPVDVLTYAFCKFSGLPEKQIIGSGTLLDTARLRTRIAESLSINQKDVQAFVLGEHGDSSFVPWSNVRISGVSLEKYRENLNYREDFVAELDLEDIENYMRTSGGKIIQRKGATFYAVSVSVCDIVKTLLKGSDSILCVSSMMHGEFGIEDVCLSIPTIVNGQGIKGTLLPELTEEEIQKLRHSADVLKGVIAQIDFTQARPAKERRETMIFSYYPGCTLSTKAKELDRYGRLAAAALGVELEEIENWQCCGAVYPQAEDEIATKLSAVRALNAAKEKNQPVLTLCSACHHVLKRVNNDMKTNDYIRTRANNYLKLDAPYAGETDVVHYLEMLRDTVGFDAIKKAVKNPLKGVKIAAYYGCLLLRPSNVMAFDDPENPQIIEDFIRAIGATPVVYSQKNECCGAYMAMEDKSFAQKRVETILSSAAEAGADMIITACPLCLYNLAHNATATTLPVKYFTELLCQALGLEKEDA